MKKLIVSAIVAAGSIISFAPSAGAKPNCASKVPNSNLVGCQIIYVDLHGLDLHGSNLNGGRVSSSNLTDTNLSGASMVGTNFAGGMWEGDIATTVATLTRTNFNGANLSKADLTGATLSSAKLNIANLSGADLTNSSLSNGDFTGTNLTKATLTGANLSGAKLAGATLTTLGLDSYLHTYVGGYETMLTEICTAIVNGGEQGSDDDLATITGHPRLSVLHVLRQLDGNGLLKLSQAIGPTTRYYGVSPKLRRLLD